MKGAALVGAAMGARTAVRTLAARRPLTLKGGPDALASATYRFAIPHPPCFGDEIRHSHGSLLLLVVFHEHRHGAAAIRKE